jgi:hypothetical protein
MRDDAMNDRDELDILLDAALASYANPEPSPNLTARILAGTREIDRQPLIRWLVWAVPALAALLLVVLLIEHHVLSSHTGSPPTARLSAAPDVVHSSPHAPVFSTPGPTTGTNRAAMGSSSSQPVKPTGVQISKPEPLPRLDVFPTPTPLSPEEQALIDLVNRNPGQVAQSAARNLEQMQEQMVEPLDVAAIHIPPLNEN